MIIETLIICGLMLAGVALLNSFGMSGWILGPLGFLCGIAVFTVFIYLQAIFGVYISPLLPLLLTILLPLAFWVYRWKITKIKLLSWKLVLVLAAITTGLASLFYGLNLYTYHYDSLRYLMVGSLMHNGDLHAITSNLLEKRFSTVSAIHSLGNFTGSYHLRSLTPLVSLSTLILLCWGVRAILKLYLTKRNVLIFSSFAVILLASSYNYIYHSFYLNSHLLIGAYMLVIAVCGWLLHAKTKEYPAASLVAVQAFSIVGLTLARVEGLMYALIVLLPTLVSSHVEIKYKKILTIIFGFTIVIQQAVVVAILLSQEKALPHHVVGFLALGVLIIIASKLFDWQKLFKKPFLLLWLAEGGLWTLLLLLFIKDPKVLTDSLYATYQNIAVVPAPWGLSLVMLLIVAGFLMIAYKFKNQISLRFPISTFMAIVFILAYLREGAYRISPADSLNRMLMQIVPLLVLFIVVSIAVGQSRLSKRKNLT